MFCYPALLYCRQDYNHLPSVLPGRFSGLTAMSDYLLFLQYAPNFVSKGALCSEGILSVVAHVHSVGLFVMPQYYEIISSIYGSSTDRTRFLHGTKWQMWYFVLKRLYGRFQLSLAMSAKDST